MFFLSRTCLALNILSLAAILFHPMACRTDDYSGLIERIHTKAIPVYLKYRGSESTRLVEIDEYDSSTGKLLNRSRVKLVRRDFFYEKPEIVRIITFEKNGKTLAPKEYKAHEGKPSLPVLDEKGLSHYSVEIVGTKAIKGRGSYEMKVIPKKRTAEHFVGSLFFAQDDLTLVAIEGSVAKMPFGVTGLRFTFYTAALDDLAVLISGTMSIGLDIPIFAPNRRYETRITALDSKPLFK